MGRHRVARLKEISIHVPREGDDFGRTHSFPHRLLFLSTSPARGTTLADHETRLRVLISIHVPREGDD